MSKGHGSKAPNQVWVGPHSGDNRVQVKQAGGERASRVFDTKREALEFARGLAQRQNAELVEQRLRDGQIMNPNSYGNDDCPPKDQVS